jgi:DNA-binding HxlR family transcriptional regulator
VRSYAQFCGLAKALDAVGDRWTLLIVRELLLQGPCRYTDLLKGLPGIATNLLAQRLRDLEAEGVVAREEAPPPIATTLFKLTPRGEALLPVLRELGRWGGPLLLEAGDGDAFHSYWMALPFDLYYRDAKPEAPPVEIELRTGDEPVVLRTVEGRVRMRRGSAERPDAILSGPPKLLIGVLSGRVDLATARRSGLELTGSEAAVARITADRGVPGAGEPAGPGEVEAGFLRVG